MRVFRANSAFLARDPNQENREEEYFAVQIPPLSLVGAWLVRFFDARELREHPRYLPRKALATSIVLETER